MADYVLKRIDQNSYATFGELRLGDKVLCVTLEDPWRNNERRVSCIPPGKYNVVRHGWNGEPVKFKQTWEVLDVPGRSSILIHSGNLPEDTLGCILVGTSRGNIDGKPAILGSRIALSVLREILPERFTLTVI